MISVQEALDILNSAKRQGPTINKTIEEALGHVLSEDVFAPIDMPPFDQSAMDGYALHMHDSDRYELIGKTKAGDSSSFVLSAGQAVRIFTGGMVPEGANTIAKQEIVEQQSDIIEIKEPIKLQQNIRPLGEQIKRGDSMLKKGTLLTPGAIGYLATLGITSVDVIRKPKVNIIATGNELVKPGIPLEAGKIYESNTYTLRAALQDSGYEAGIHTVEDDYDSTKLLIESVMRESDVLILTGGISVGEYDYVGKALQDIGTEQLFYKVKQKPGKPLYVGKKDSTLVFALPGNPAAALSCFYIYALPVLNHFMGKNGKAHVLECMLKNDFQTSPNLTHFLKARTDGKNVEILGAQSSAMLSSFVDANCLAISPEGEEKLTSGNSIQVIPILAF